MIPIQRLVLAVATVLLVTLIISYSAPSIPQKGLSYFQDSLHAYTGPSGTNAFRGFHLLLPATASNVNLCRLLLSTTILGYPEPILIGWNGHGEYNGTKSHLFKISETLAYLNSLPPSMDDDLVLELDAYDIWMQVRPDVLIERYYRAIDKADKRLEEEGILDKDNRGTTVRQTVLFGPDKICWPSSWGRPACWAVPDSPLDRKAFGPVTDHAAGEQNRPRWLNSGTIMGPVKDVRDVFAVTMDLVRKTFDENYQYHDSDQYYFSDVWADQEVSRMLLRDGKASAPEGKEMAHLESGKRSEYRIVLDHESIAFATAALYSEYFTWMALNNTNPVPNSPYTHGQTRRRIDQFTLPADIAASTPPFAAAQPEDKLPSHKGWSDLKLGTNTITEDVFPLFHMTGDKSIRDRWWPKMWYYQYGQRLLKAAMRQKLNSTETAHPFATVRGTAYVGAKYELETSTPGVEIGRDGGVGWTDQGEYLSWDGLCKSHAEGVFIHV
nr:hypothetical protein CFP56_37357 [Quercus suber]